MTKFSLELKFISPTSVIFALHPHIMKPEERMVVPNKFTCLCLRLCFWGGGQIRIVDSWQVALDHTQRYQLIENVCHSLPERKERTHTCFYLETYRPHCQSHRLGDNPAKKNTCLSSHIPICG